MRRSFLSSGDLIADRRHAYGSEFAKAGDFSSAIDLFIQAIERAPNWAPAWHALARARLNVLDRADAIAAFRESLRIDRNDALGASLELARLDASVDLAPGMVAVASKKGVYDSLVQGELLSHLLAPGEKFDLIIASDVFTYLGDLSRVMNAVAAQLAPGGIAAFSVEKGEREDWTVGESLRFAHSADYLQRLAAAAKLSVISLTEAVLRKDRGADIAGLIALLKAPAGPVAPEAAAGASLARPVH